MNMLRSWLVCVERHLRANHINWNGLWINSEIQCTQGFHPNPSVLKLGCTWYAQSSNFSLPAMAMCLCCLQKVRLNTQAWVLFPILAVSYVFGFHRRWIIPVQQVCPCDTCVNAYGNLTESVDYVHLIDSHTCISGQSRMKLIFFKKSSCASIKLYFHSTR